MRKYNMTMTINHPKGAKDYELKGEYCYNALKVARILHPDLTSIVLVLVPWTEVPPT